MDKAFIQTLFFFQLQQDFLTKDLKNCQVQGDLVFFGHFEISVFVERSRLFCEARRKKEEKASWESSWDLGSWD